MAATGRAAQEEKAMRRLVLLLFILGLVAESAPAAAPNLDQLVQATLERNAAIAQSRYEVEKAEAVVEKTWGQFDLRLDGQANYSDAQTEPTSIMAPESTEAFNYKLGLSNKLLIGGRVSLDLTSTRTNLLFEDISIPGLDPSLLTTSVNPAYQPELMLSYTQPLLKDFWGRPDQVALEIGDLQMKMAKLSLLGTTVDQVEKIKEAYFAWIMAQRLLKIQRVSLRENEQYFKQTRRMRAIGLREEKDLLQTQAYLLSTRSEIQPAENGVKAAGEILLNLTGFSPEEWEQLKVVSAEPPAKFELPGELSPEQEDKLLAGQPAVRLAESGLRLAALSLKVSENIALPSLSVFGSYKLAGLDGDQAGSLSEMTSGEYPTWALGLNFSMYLPNRSSGGEVKTRQAERETAREQLADAKKNLRTFIRTAYREAKSAQQGYHFKQQARELLERTLKIQTRHFAQGRTSTRELLMAQADFHGAQLKEVSAWRTFRQALNTWNKITGAYDAYYQDLAKE